MKNVIKLSAVNSTCNDPPEEAKPYSSKFDIDVMKRFVDSNLEKMYGFLNEAGKNGVDLVCTCEDFKGCDAYMRFMDKPHLFSTIAEEIPGPVSVRIGEIARQYNMHVAANCYEKDNDQIFNTTVLIGRDGKIIGKYRKVHLPASEKWMVTPGKELSIFETDIGRIGFAVCYDIVFTEHCRALALNGADIIIHPTEGWGISKVSSSYIGEALLRIRAAENMVYMVVAKNIRYGSDGKSCIINNAGEIIAELAGKVEGIATAEFAADYDIVREEHFDTFFSGISSIRARLAIEREPSLYSIIAEKNPDLLERYKKYKLLNKPDEIKEVARLWKEFVEADMEKRPSNLKYHW